MCGILLHFAPQVKDFFLVDEFIEFDEHSANAKICSDRSELFNKLIPYVEARGPDYSSLRVMEEHNISWYFSVLSLRQPFTAQSIHINEKYILQFNGELYNSEVTGNDTKYIVELLSTPNPNVIDVIRKLDGEFAYTIYDIEHRVFYFGRDQIGRRSLCYKINENNGELYVASVTGSAEGFLNCIGGIIYTYDTKSLLLNDNVTVRELFQVCDFIDEDVKRENNYIDGLYDCLYDSVEKRVMSVHPAHIENSPLSILFSGGLDCSVIVALICEVLNQSKRSDVTVELLNVGFENPRTGLFPKDAPDRKLALNSFKILQKLYKNINIILVEIDVPYDEYLNIRPKVIDLIYPKDTEMDLSIAIAFYFAARGRGFTTNSDNKREPYTRKGIVLFSGLGADELYGGYHKFSNKTSEELTVELTRQINNIHDRNLNRDDKVIADNGVEVRYPFLDEKVIKYSVSEIPINYKQNKKILRSLASQKLTLGIIADEPKRAIQFGSKSAKMTKDGNKHGTDTLK